MSHFPDRVHEIPVSHPQEEFWVGATPYGSCGVLSVEMESESDTEQHGMVEEAEQ